MCKKGRNTAQGKAAPKRPWLHPRIETMEEKRRAMAAMSSEEETMASSPTSCCGTCRGDDGNTAGKKKNGKGKKEEEEKKCELVGYGALPEWLKDNEFIHGYYRCEWPMKETILSIFSIHNETLNVWFHLLGFLLFLCLTVLTAMVIPRAGITSNIIRGSDSMRSYWGDLMAMANMTGVLRHEAVAACLLQPAASTDLSEDDEIQTISICPTNTSSSSSHHHHTAIQIQEEEEEDAGVGGGDPITRWPMFAYLGGAMVCLLTSSACHLVMCHSERTAYVTLRLDYAGIAALIVTSFYPLAYYSFLCHPALQRLYMGSITALGAAAAAASLVPAFQSPALRPLRAALFSCMGVSGVVPIAHKLVLHGGGARREEAVASACYEAVMGAMYGLGAAVYAARVPERWAPGRFDLVGHSHQLFHLFVVAGAYAHYLGALQYLKWRDAEKC